MTKYPQAAGAALYTHKAFGVHFLTFIVVLHGDVLGHHLGLDRVKRLRRVPASTASASKEDWPAGSTPLLVIALAFMALVAAVNFRGVGESVKANVVLTLVELSGLLLVIFVGLYAVIAGQGRLRPHLVFESPSDKNIFFAITAATSLAFFAMVGFEDSVNMAEETHDPVKNFPKMMLTGLGITGIIYVLVSITAVALVPVGELGEQRDAAAQGGRAGAPTSRSTRSSRSSRMFAVANSALINMLMASRLLYGMARQEVLPPFLGKVHPTRRTPVAAILFTTASPSG